VRWFGSALLHLAHQTGKSLLLNLSRIDLASSSSQIECGRLSLIQLSRCGGWGWVGGCIVVVGAQKAPLVAWTPGGWVAASSRPAGWPAGCNEFYGQNWSCAQRGGAPTAAENSTSRLTNSNIKISHAPKLCSDAGEAKECIQGDPFFSAAGCARWKSWVPPHRKNGMSSML